MRRLLSFMLIFTILFGMFPGEMAWSQETIQPMDGTIRQEGTIITEEDEELLSQETVMRSNEDRVLEDMEQIDFTEEVEEDQGIPIGDPQFVEDVESLKGRAVNPSMMRTQLAATTSSIPDPRILKTIGDANIRQSQAPFSISNEFENISTMDGSLSVEETDLTLPGRNGLSFTLTRMYDSANSSFFKKGYQVSGYCNCYIAFHGAKFKETENIVTKEKSETFLQNGFMTHITAEMGYIDSAVAWYGYFAARKQDGAKAMITAWSDADSAGNRSRIVTYVTMDRQVSLVQEFYNALDHGYRDRVTEKTEEEQLFPIGKGWSWDIPYITWDQNRSFLKMGRQGSYEISGNTLKNYPFKDLTLANDSTVKVNGLSSSRVLKTNKGLRYYFASNGKLIQIADAYNNTVQFHYNTHEIYGNVLTDIIDAIGNKIHIEYSKSAVVLTQGTKTVTYDKKTHITYDQHRPFVEYETELLAKVTDPQGRNTQYTYNLAKPTYKISTRLPDTINPAALLSQIVYPTGAKTEYTYGSVRREIGSGAHQYEYRISSRKDIANGQQSNRQDYTYTSPSGFPTDYASSYNQNIANFYVNVSDGLTTTVFDHRKKVTNENEAPVIYTNQFLQKVGDEQKVTTFKYDEAKKNTRPIETSTQYKKGTQSLAELKTTRVYDDFGNIVTETNPRGVTVTYGYSATGLLISQLEPASATESRYTSFTRNSQGSVTQIQVRANQVNGPLLSQVSINQFDAYGNPLRTTIKDDSKDIVYITEFGAAYNYAFPTKQTIQTSKVNGQTQQTVNTFTYDKSTGLVMSYTDGKGYQTKLQYDKLNRLVSVIHPDNSSSGVTFNDVLNQAIMKDGVCQDSCREFSKNRMSSR